MELFLIIISVLGSLALIYVFNLVKPRHDATKNEPLHPLPPGSRGWPVIGETLEYLSTARKGVPEKFVADRRNKYTCKVFKTSLFLQDMAMLCTAAGNKFLFSNENNLVKSWWPAYINKIIFPNSENTNVVEESTHFRTILAPYLRPSGLQKYIGVIDSVTKKHLGMYWDQNDVVKVYTLAKKYTFTLACRLVLDTENQQVLAKLEEHMIHLSAGLSSLPINLPGTKFNRGIRGSKQLKQEIASIVSQRRLHLSSTSTTCKVVDDGHVDMLSSLLMETDSEGQLVEESEIVNKLYGVIVAGYDNISSVLATIVLCLAEFSDIYEAVLKEQTEIVDSKEAGELLNWGDIEKMKYSWNVAREVLRMYPPNLGTFREAMTDFIYEGYLIPKGTKLNWNVLATHRNEDYFPNPEKFDPSRFEGRGPAPYSYVPFGGGPRMCPGKDYARLEILVFMHNVVTRYKWEKVFPEEKVIWDPALVPTKGLPIRLYAHKSDR